MVVYQLLGFRAEGIFPWNEPSVTKGIPMIYRILSVTPLALKLTILVAGLVVNDAGESLRDQAVRGFREELATIFLSGQEDVGNSATDADRDSSGTPSQGHIRR